MKRILVICLTVLASLFVAGLALAASGKPGVAILVEGADADVVRRELVESIPQGVPVQDPSELSASVAGMGVRSVADALANPRTRKQTLVAVRKALKQTGLAAALSARSKRVGKGREIRVVLVVRGQAEPIVEENLSIGKGERASAQLTPLLAVPLQDIGSAPAPSQPADADPAVEKPAKPAKREAKKERDNEEDEEAPPPTPKDTVAKKRGPLTFSNALVVAEAGVDIGNRQMRYVDIAYAATPLRGYAQPGIPAFSVAVQIYPAADQGIPVAKDLGLVGGYADSLVFQAKTSDGTQSTKGKWTRFHIGVRGRILVGEKPNSPLVGVEGTYGGSRYHFGSGDVISQDLPENDYKYVRLGADARVPFGPAAVFGGLGYMNILSSGRFGEIFPHATIGGLDAKVGGAYAFLPWLEARASFAYTRIFSNAHSAADGSDPYAAGGALDSYYVGNIGVSAIF
jgi:hypothetical protein